MYPIVLNAEFGRYHLTQGCPTRGPGGAMWPGGRNAARLIFRCGPLLILTSSSVF